MFSCSDYIIHESMESQVAQATLIHVCVENILYPKKCSLPDTLHALQRPAPLRSARRGRSGIECRPVQRVQRPGVCVVPCVVCPASGMVCPAVCDVQAFRVRWGAGAHRRGIQPPPSPARSVFQPPKNKKTHLILTTKPHLIVQASKFSKNKKRPLSRSNLCYT